MQKYKDTIILDAKIAKTPLPILFYQEVETYLNSYKKLAVQKKKEGKVAEDEANPITHVFFKLILGWEIAANNTHAWFQSLVQWNCMACGVNVEPLGFHNISLRTDSMRLKYDDSKTKKFGEKLSIKIFILTLLTIHSIFILVLEFIVVFILINSLCLRNSF